MNDVECAHRVAIPAEESGGMHCKFSNVSRGTSPVQLYCVQKMSVTRINHVDPTFISIIQSAKVRNMPTLSDETRTHNHSARNCHSLRVQLKTGSEKEGVPWVCTSK